VSPRALPVRSRAVAALLSAAALLVAGCAGDESQPAAQTAPRPSGRATPSYVVPPCPELAPRAGASDLPDLTLPCLGAGPAVDLADLRGTPTVLNVWAAWCTICADEMPVLADGVRRAGDRVRFFGVHYKAPAGFGRQSAADFGVAFPSVQDTDGDKTTLALRVGGPPQTLFFTADGRLAGRHPGAIRSAAELDRLVDRYLGVRL
jgi:thiol-disulfide isomerase/thioredoxin